MSCLLHKEEEEDVLCKFKSAKLHTPTKVSCTHEHIHMLLGLRERHVTWHINAIYMHMHAMLCHTLHTYIHTYIQKYKHTNIHTHMHTYIQRGL